MARGYLQQRFFIFKEPKKTLSDKILEIPKSMKLCNTPIKPSGTTSDIDYRIESVVSTEMIEFCTVDDINEFIKNILNKKEYDKTGVGLAYYDNFCCTVHKFLGDRFK